MVKREFKAGDTVRVVGNDSCGHSVGSIGTVYAYNSSSNVLYVRVGAIIFSHHHSTLEHVTEATPVKTRTVTRKALAEIYPNVCVDWQKRIDNILLTNKFGDEFEVSNSLVDLVYVYPCNAKQLAWIFKHLPKPKKMVTKEAVLYLNILKNGVFIDFTNEQRAVESQHRCDEVIARAVKVTGTYQIEE